MSVQSFWIHGNALLAEHQENVEKVTNAGWGVEVELKDGKDCWFHIPLTAPALHENTAAYLETVYLLFYTNVCSIKEVHIYDGSIKIGEYKDLDYKGEHRFLKDTFNTFRLKHLHPVFSGIGISFCCAAIVDEEETTTQTETPRLIVASAGAEYKMQRRFFEEADTEEEVVTNE